MRRPFDLKAPCAAPCLWLACVLILAPKGTFNALHAEAREVLFDWSGTATGAGTAHANAKMKDKMKRKDPGLIVPVNLEL